jgi:hypothetical protein
VKTSIVTWASISISDAAQHGLSNIARMSEISFSLNEMRRPGGRMSAHWPIAAQGQCACMSALGESCRLGSIVRPNRVTMRPLRIKRARK